MTMTCQSPSAFTVDMIDGAGVRMTFGYGYWFMSNVPAGRST